MLSTGCLFTLSKMSPGVNQPMRPTLRTLHSLHRTPFSSLEEFLKILGLQMIIRARCIQGPYPHTLEVR